MIKKVSDRVGKLNELNKSPIVFKEGKKVDFSSVSDQWIDGDILEEEMSYVARMSEGLATGTMSDDKEYMLLKNKVVRDMIKEKTVSLKKKLCNTAKRKSSIYDDAKMVQDKALKRIQDYARIIAKDNTIEIYLDEMNGDYKIKRSNSPVSVRRNRANGSSYKWHTIDANILKKEIAEREQVLKDLENQEVRDENILKEVEEKLVKQDKKSKKKVTKKSNKRKTPKKRDTKKKAVSKKKIIKKSKRKK